MSATIGVWLERTEPELTIEVFERLDVGRSESSDAWNNAALAMPHSVNSTTHLSSQWNIDILKPPRSLRHLKYRKSSGRTCHGPAIRTAAFRFRNTGTSL